eukprot:40217-Chlamydomonas_euryale.AAC.5
MPAAERSSTSAVKNAASCGSPLRVTRSRPKLLRWMRTCAGAAKHVVDWLAGRLPGIYCTNAGHLCRKPIHLCRDLMLGTYSLMPSTYVTHVGHVWLSG